MAGDAPESSSGRYFVVVNGLGVLCGEPLLSSLYRARGRCWRIKKGIAAVALSPEMGTKKGTLSLIGQCAVKKIRLPLIKWSVSLALEHRPALGKRQAFSYSTEAFLAC